MSTKSRTILVVDDKINIRDLVTETLNLGDFELLTASSGEAALEIVARTTPDLVLLDVMMPGGMDGYETCRRIKDCPEGENIQVILLTALGQQRDLGRGRAAGADGYIVKPFSPLDLLEQVEGMLGLADEDAETVDAMP
jgi:two-component system, OmpR family, phosphate regulon response regulator PhoB